MNFSKVPARRLELQTSVPCHAHLFSYFCSSRKWHSTWILCLSLLLAWFRRSLSLPVLAHLLLLPRSFLLSLLLHSVLLLSLMDSLRTSVWLLTRLCSILGPVRSGQPTGWGLLYLSSVTLSSLPGRLVHGEWDNVQYPGAGSMLDS